MPPLIGAALISLGVSASIAGPLSSIIFTGLSIALSILFAPKVPEPEAGRIPFKQTVPPRIRIIGTRRTAGAFMLYHSTSLGEFVGIVALCEGKANAFTRYYLHDDVIELMDDGVTVAELGGEGRYGQGRVKITTRLGLANETSHDDAVDLLDFWTADHRGDGIASAMIIVNDGTAEDRARLYPLGLPVLSVEVNATDVLDPRDIDQQWDVPATWSGTGNDNPILQAVWFLTASIEQGGMGLDFEEAILPVLNDVIDAADICDEAVPLKAGGTEERYRSGALYLFSDDPGEVLAAILGTCDGFCAERGDGSFTFKAGKWTDDDFSVVIQNKHIISLNVRRFRVDEDEVTGVIVRYNSVPHGHTAIDAPVWPRDAYQGGEDKRIRTIEIIYCPSGTQAQRLSKRVATYEMAPVTGTAVLKMYGILLLDKRGATIQCTDDPALADAKVRLTRVEPNLVNGTVEIDFTVFDPDVCDAWTAATEEGPLQPVIPPQFEDLLTTPSNLNAVASMVNQTIIVDVSFDPGDLVSDATEFSWRWRHADIGDGIPGLWHTGQFAADVVEKPEPDLWIVTFSGMPKGNLEFQLRAHQADSSMWSVSAFANTKLPAPGRPRKLEFAFLGSGTPRVELTWRNPNSANMHHARVYRAVSGAGFALADDVSGELPGKARSLGSFFEINVPSGTYDYWVVAENFADVGSLPAGPETITVL